MESLDTIFTQGFTLLQIRIYTVPSGLKNIFLHDEESIKQM